MLVLILLCGEARKLLKSAVLVRHGARQPVLKNEDALLTPVGLRQCTLLGAQFRDKYSAWLPQTFNHTFLTAFTTSFQRTRVCLAAFLYGLFPLGTGARLNTTDPALLQPPWSQSQSPGQAQAGQFALSAGYTPGVSNNGDRLMNYCPEYDARLDQAKSQFRSAGQKVFTDNIRLMQKVSGYYSIQNITVWDIYYVYDRINSQKYAGQPNRDFSAPETAQLEKIATWTFTQLYAGHFGAVLASPLLDHVVSFLEQPSSDGLRVFACHDDNLVSYLVFLGLTAPNCVLGQDQPCVRKLPFASSMVFQLLREENGTDTVEVSFNGRVVQSQPLAQWAAFVKTSLQPIDYCF